MGKPYSAELDAFPSTFQWAAKQEIRNLKNFLTRWIGDHMAVVGSGGSFSAAATVALFRELAHHSVTTTHTPLEHVQTLEHLSPKTLLLSAEGKNKDILAAATATARADVAACGVTLTKSNPLADLARRGGSPRLFTFEMDWVKDGYLATNSLLAMTLLFYRVFFGDEAFRDNIGPLLAEGRLIRRRAEFSSLCEEIRKHRRPLLVIHSARAKLFAIDLESKLAESAWGTVQITDLRQFAHGRHLQLAYSDQRPFPIAVNAEMERGLARATTALLPEDPGYIAIEIDGSTVQDTAIAGLVDAMLFTEALAIGLPYDIGQPTVPSFGYSIHSIDPWPLVAGHDHEDQFLDRAVRRKVYAGAKTSSTPGSEVRKAAEQYFERLCSSKIKAIVCDFDGTLCRAEDRFDLMDSTLVALVSELIREGLHVAIATGRGGSLKDNLVKSFAEDLHGKIQVGYYSGSLIKSLAEPFDTPIGDPAFQELIDWLRTTVHGEFNPTMVDCGRLGQFTIKVPSPRHAGRLLNAIRAWIVRSERDGWRAYCSGHSVDVLVRNTSKRRVVEHVCSLWSINPMTELLRIGDCGHEDGNDFELLSEGVSLSCDSVSTDLNSCWNFGRRGNNQSETTNTYLRALVRTSEGFRVAESSLLNSD